MKKPLILLSNDDGVESRGIIALHKTLKPLGDVYVVAPSSEKSATSHSVTLHRPLRANPYGKYIYAVDGTPADCILLAVRWLLPRMPDLVVSGINLGANIGDDVHYSGTVSAAREASILDIPSIAISAISEETRPKTVKKPKYSLDIASNFAKCLARAVLKHSMPKGTFLNVNVPYKAEDHEITFLGRRDYGDRVSEKIDPRGEKYYWLAAEEPSTIDIPGSDCNAVARGKISVTPLHIDVTHKPLLEELGKWHLRKK